MRSWLAWPSEEGAAVGVALPPVPCPLQRPHCGPFPHPGPALGRDGPGGPLAWLRGTVSSRRGWGLAGGMGPPRVWRPVLPLPREERLHKLHRPLRAGPPSAVSSEALCVQAGAEASSSFWLRQEEASAGASPCPGNVTAVGVQGLRVLSPSTVHRGPGLRLARAIIGCAHS